jgi:transcriptional regulator with XRE-family HTH domain
MQVELFPPPTLWGTCSDLSFYFGLQNSGPLLPLSCLVFSAIRFLCFLFILGATERLVRVFAPRYGDSMKKTRPLKGLTLEEVSRASGVPPNTLRRHLHNFPDYLPAWREGRSLRLPLAAVTMAAHIAHFYRQGLTTPEVAAKLREGLPHPAKTLRHDSTTLLPALERQSQALEAIGKELSLLRQKKNLAKAKTIGDDDLPF